MRTTPAREASGSGPTGSVAGRRRNPPVPAGPRAGTSSVHTTTVRVARDPGSAPPGEVSTIVETASSSPGATTESRRTAPGGFAVHVTRGPSLAEATLHGELDLATVSVLREVLATAATTRAMYVTLDLSRLTFIDGAGLGTILDARRALRSHQGDLTILAPSPCVRRILEITEQTGLVAPPTEAPSVPDRREPGQDTIKAK